MNHASDFDVFREWGRTVTRRRFETTVERRYDVAAIRKRAHGQGRIRSITGLDDFRRDHGRPVVWDTLLWPGAPRRDGRKTIVSDGFIMLRHSDLAATLALAGRLGTDVQLHAA